MRTMQDIGWRTVRIVLKVYLLTAEITVRGMVRRYILAAVKCAVQLNSLFVKYQMQTFNGYFKLIFLVRPNIK